MAGRVAVCVDGENIGGTHGEAINGIAKRHGSIDVRRVYGNIQAILSWHDTPGYRLVHSGSGKNAADILLSIDAMKLALHDNIGTIVIAASDRDYTHVAHHLREVGVTVIGIGEPKAPVDFRATCTEFVELPSRPVLPELDKNIRAAIAEKSQNGSGMRITELNPWMRIKHGTKISTLPEKNWRSYLGARPALYDLDPRGPNARVRVRPGSFGAA